MARHRSDLVIRLIALFKLVKAAALIAVGIGAMSMQEHSRLREWVHAFSVDPHGKYLTELLAKLTAMKESQLHELGAASLIYASVFVVEGIGLLWRKPWAEVMTVIVTVSFVPLEIYELVVHATLAKVAVIIANVIIVVYLLWRLRREGHWPFHRRGAAAAVEPAAP